MFPVTVQTVHDERGVQWKSGDKRVLTAVTGSFMHNPFIPELYALSVTALRTVNGVHDVHVVAKFHLFGNQLKAVSAYRAFPLYLMVRVVDLLFIQLPIQ